MPFSWGVHRMFGGGGESDEHCYRVKLSFECHFRGVFIECSGELGVSQTNTVTVSNLALNAIFVGCS